MNNHLEYLVGQSYENDIVDKMKARTRLVVDYEIETDLYHKLHHQINWTFHYRWGDDLMIRTIIRDDIKDAIFMKWKQVNKSSVLLALQK